ncbi:MAG: flagellar biosynthesis protein FlhB [Candidatus Jidaibacter sp.]|jgi:flagellar biosynthetic protein FlhB|nr:flagellar biosynthesis protein FlhB [Candidatus Jidaibacter sp.]
MAEEQDDSQKTEEPTQKRIEDAIKKGKVVYSKEVTSFVMLSLLTALIAFVLPSLSRKITFNLSSYIANSYNFQRDYTGSDILPIVFSASGDLFIFAIIPFIVAIVGIVLGNFLQNGFISSPEAIIPDLSKISPIAGFKRIFSLKSVVELLKGVVKISIIGCTAYYAVYSEIQFINFIHDVSVADMMAILLKISIKMMIAICVLQGAIAALDYLYERHTYLKNLKMTKQEVKDELKQNDGDPEIKAKIRSIRIQRSRQRITSAMPKADLVITNPVHFAVALSYDPESMHAPKLVAKGQDKMALRIKEIAKELDITIVENPPLARAIYNNVDWDEFIHADHYKAVAQIMTKLKKFSSAANGKK